MYLIDNIDFVSSLSWFISGLLDEVTNIINTIITCPVDLDNIKYTAIVESSTVLTLMTWISILEIGTVDSLCQYTSACCFSCSARTRKNVGMSNSVHLERIAKYRRNHILSDDRIPVSRAVFGIERHEDLQVKSWGHCMKNTRKYKKTFYLLRI